jgi:predicted RNA-binding protein (TIGR00451 family)
MQTKEDRHVRKFIVQAEAVAKSLPSVWVDMLARERIRQGSPVFAPGIVQLTSKIKKGEVVAIFGTDGELWGLGVAELSADEMLRAEKGLAVKTDVVLIS